MSSGNQKTNVVDYPLPAVSGALYADVAGDGTVSYEWRRPSVVAATCSIIATAGATTADPVTVHITTTATDTDAATAATIYYTLDGSTPTTASPVYTTAVTVTVSCTVSAIASYVVGTVPTTTVVATHDIVIQIPVLAFNYGHAISALPVARTADGGHTWNQLPVPPLAVTGNYGRVSYGMGNLGVADTSFSLYLTSDHGNTWKSFSSKMSYYYSSSVPSVDVQAFYIADHDMLGGVSVVVGYSANIPIGSNVGAQSCVWYSVDGVHYTQASILNLPTSAYCYASRSSANYPQPRAIAYRNDVWIITMDSGYLRSTDPSVWTYYAYPVTASTLVIDTLATPWGFVIQTSAYMYYSTDAGVTFGYRGISAYDSHICVLKHTGLVIVMADSGNAILYTTDGITWTAGSTLLSYVDYLFDCASTKDKDVLLPCYFGSSAQGHRLTPLELYDGSGSGKRNISSIPFTYAQAGSNNNSAVSLTWAGANLLAASPMSGSVCMSTDAMFWDEVTPGVPVGTIMIAEDTSTAPAVVAPAPIPTPLSSVVSGSYNCTTAGPTGAYTFVIGLGGYVILYTLDGTDPDVSQASLLLSSNTVSIAGGGTSITLTAGTTKRIRAIAVGFDGRRSTTPLDITVTAVQI